MPDFPFVDNERVVEYAPALDLLSPSGTHSTGLLFCALDPGIELNNIPEATQIMSLDNTEECLANPFPPTNPPIPSDQLTVEEFEGLELILIGLDQLLDEGAFETLTELFIEDFL
jgi:hypothetical protein